MKYLLSDSKKKKKRKITKSTYIDGEHRREVLVFDLHQLGGGPRLLTSVG